MVIFHSYVSLPGGSEILGKDMKDMNIYRNREHIEHMKIVGK